MKVGVIGSRKWKNNKLINNFLDNNKNKITEIISGDAEGPDKMGARWGRKNNKDICYFPPDNKRKHKYHYRNRLIAERADVIVAFWDGSSTGTMYTCDYAKKIGKPVIIIKANTVIDHLTI